MTQYERMVQGLIYDPGDPVILEEQMPYLDLIHEFNQLKATEADKKTAYMKKVFASCGENCYIELPFHANWGGHHVHLGTSVYLNANCALVDDGQIYIGDHVMIGPNVMIATANHPINPELRAKGYQYTRDVHIGENVWIGGNVSIVPGVTIGKNSVIGAGSVVTRDIPENSIAVGNPCRVIRRIGPRDEAYFYRDEKIDWENLQ